nr:MAG TPA: large terminase [Caudoviricetes sp.]
MSCNRRWNFKTGATGSGKSYLDIAATIPKRILASKGEGLLVLFGNTRGTLERNIIEPMRDLWPELIGQIRSDNTIHMFGKKVYVLGADNKKHVARIQGTSIEYAYGDEVTTWSEDVFSMLKSRLRCRHSHFDGTCNPDNPNHWVKKFLDSDADIYHQDYVIEDGALPLHVIEELKKEYAGTVFYDRFILGRWVAAEGVIYRNFADNPERYIIDNPPEIKFATIGVDFGGNESATAFSCTGYTNGFREVVTLEEYYQKGITSPSALEAAFLDFVRICKSKYRVTTAYCDSAEQTLIQGLKTAALREGVGIIVKNAQKGPINERIRAYCVLMGADRYKILRRCKHTIEALQTAVWDGRNMTKDIRLDDGTYNIDSLDALEYSTERYMNTIIRLGVGDGRTCMA